MPARMRRSYGPHRRSGSRRRAVWAQFDVRNLALPASTLFSYNVLGQLQSGIANQSLPTSTTGGTVVRLLINAGFGWDTAAAENQEVNFGLRKATLAEVQFNTLNANDANQDWMFYNQCVPGTGVNSALTSGAVPLEGFRWDIRSKRTRVMNLTARVVLR